MSTMNDLMQIINSPRIAEDIQRRGEEINIALRIKEKRLEMGWTQSELATKMGVAQNVISRIESLEGGISSGTIGKFCKATDLTLKFIDANDINLEKSIKLKNQILEKLEIIEKQKAEIMRLLSNL